MTANSKSLDEEFEENPFAKTSKSSRKVSWGGDWPQRYVDMVYGIAYRYLRAYHDEALRDTIVQELFLVMNNIKNDPRFEHRAWVSTYLGMESRRIRRQYLAANSREESLDTVSPQYVDQSCEQEDLATARYLSLHIVEQGVQEALKHLEPFERWVIQKRFLEGMTYKEILAAYNEGRDRIHQMQTLAPFHAHVQSGLYALKRYLKHHTGKDPKNPYEKV